MKHPHILPTVSPLFASLAAGLLMCGAAAQAASGITVEHSQEALVTRGMDTTAVQLALGRPEHTLTFDRGQGSTWTYRVAGSEDTVFDVDFSTAGTVASVGERVQEMGGGHRGRR